jgi:hypothetical protein
MKKPKKPNEEAEFSRGQFTARLFPSILPNGGDTSRHHPDYPNFVHRTDGGT